MRFGDVLKSIRTARNLSQQEMADLLGTSKQVVSRYENHQRVPKVSTVAHYAATLNVPFAYLSGEEPSASATPALPHPALLPIKVRRRVPILGNVACGDPIYNPGDGTEFIDVEDDVPCTFALVAQGESMIGDRIHDGDVVFIRAQGDVIDGEIAAVSVDDEVTLKHISREYDVQGNVRLTLLLSSNPKFPPIFIGGPDETRNVRILGKAVAVKFML